MTLYKKLFFLGIVFLVALYPTSFLSAARTNSEVESINGEISKKKIELQGLRGKIKSYEENIAHLRRESATLENQLAILSNRIAKTEMDIRAAKLEIESLALEIEAAKILVNDQRQEIEKQKKFLAELIFQIYKSDGKNLLEVLLLNDSFSDFFNEIEYLQSTNESLRSLLASLKKFKNELESKQAQLETQKTALQKMQDALEEKQEKLTEELAAKEILLGETLSSESKFRDLVAQSRREQTEINTEISELEETVQQKMREGDLFGGGETVILTWPLSSSFRTITAYFHDPDYPFRYIFEHPAVDIRVPQGTGVLSSAPGYVLRSRDAGYGYNYVIILHSGGIATVYGHLSKIFVAADTYVTRGQMVGLSGGAPGTPGAGRLTFGPHLHFEVRQNGIPVNPLEYLISF